MNSLQTSSLSLLSLLTFLSLLPNIFSTYSPSPAPAPAPQSIINADEEFIRASCNLTLYPDVCYAALIPYAPLVHGNSSLLARYAVTVCLFRAQNMLNYITGLSRQVNTGNSSPQPRCKAALRDCYSTFDDAVDQIKQSVEEMKSLGDGERLRFQMSNVLTWMSAALTNEDTCTDGFDEVVECDGEIKVGVCSKGEVVRKYTSNGLALVNNFAKQQGERRRD